MCPGPLKTYIKLYSKIIFKYITSNLILYKGNYLGTNWMIIQYQRVIFIKENYEKCSFISSNVPVEKNILERIQKKIS